MQKYLIIIILMLVSCVKEKKEETIQKEETIIVYYSPSNIKDEVRGEYVILEHQVGKTWGTCNQYICKNQYTDEVFRVFTTCTSTCFDIGDNVILKSGCTLEGIIGDKIMVRSRKSLERDYKDTPIVAGTIIMIGETCGYGTEF